jgi:hypothetical protein
MGQNRNALVALGVIVVLALGGIVFALTRGGDDTASSTTSRPSRTTVASSGPASTIAGATTLPTGTPSLTTLAPGVVDPAVLQPGEVLLEPVGVSASDPFTDPANTGVEAAPAVPLPSVPLPTTTAPLPSGQVAVQQVAGNQPGLYGGTRNNAACDKERMITFLESHPDKAAAWAGVQGIPATEIRSFISSLTSVILTRDTRVTNHGFRNGAAYAHQSVLQAGSAVLVDGYGVPRAKCSCGNPLLPPIAQPTPPTYVGPTWPTFVPTTVIVVVQVTVVTNGFVIVDLGDGTMILRPIGAGIGTTDTPITTEERCVLFPTDPSCASAGGEPIDLLNVGNTGGVNGGAASAPAFTVDRPTRITLISTYHYGAGTPAGLLGLQAADGTFYGPFTATGIVGQDGMPDATWQVEPDLVVPAGTYSVYDSEPSTWSTNAEADLVGFAIVSGIVGVADPVSAPGTPPATVPPGTVPPDGSSTADLAALTIIDQLLLDCGYNITDWTDLGGTDSAWTWMAATPKGSATFVVFDPLGDWSVGESDEVAANIAIECGFYAP